MSWHRVIQGWSSEPCDMHEYTHLVHPTWLASTISIILCVQPIYEAWFWCSHLTIIWFVYKLLLFFSLPNTFIFASCTERWRCPKQAGWEGYNYKSYKSKAEAERKRGRTCIYTLLLHRHCSSLVCDCSLDYYLLLKTCYLNYRLPEMCVYSCICMQNIGSHLYISAYNSCTMNQ